MIPFENSTSKDVNRRTLSASPKTRIDLKIVIMGHGGVGKTSFINRYIHNNFEETISTIGASFVLKKWKNFYLGIWDTAGQERFTKISSYYCRGAQAAILAYDITDRSSFEALENYARFLSDADKDCLVIVIGTKLDLANQNPSNRQVSPEEGEQYAWQHRAFFYETSAKDNLDVSSVFDRIGHECFPSKPSPGETPTESSPTSNSHHVIVAAAALTNAPAPATALPSSSTDFSTKKVCCSVQ